ncbi:MAG: GIY-YIG nuclease family protein, partial [Syntrophomonadaceae bacterium]|nr:GIY-YIG nuclease family protein [Syntrophomonadaceae bacterium]
MKTARLWRVFLRSLRLIIRKDIRWYGFSGKGGGGVKERLKNVSRQPGVYMFKDENDKVLYVGKARILRNRMRSYFQSPSRLAPKVKAMMAKVTDFDYIVTANEVEALILESNLIKSYRPRYNIMLRDDKSYPYLKITMGEEFPRLVITREKKDRVSKYFGPYSDVTALRETVKLLTSLFPIRTCRKLRQRERPCLNQHIERCLAPCVGGVDPETYREMVEAIIRFLEGDHGQLLKEMEQEMKEAA